MAISQAVRSVHSEVVRFTPGECRIFTLREKLLTSQWSEKYRRIITKPLPGPWRNEITPYTVEPMDTLDLPWVQRIILQWAPQTGKTQVAFNYLCKKVDLLPGPCMYVGPDEKVTKRISRKHILPTLRGSARIAALLSNRKDDASTLSVLFTNGASLLMAWATSAAEISSESIELLIRDETDKFPAFTGREADPFSLTDVRTNAFPHTKKIIDISTPSDEAGYIGKALDTEADEIRYYHAICPICGEAQIMRFRQFSWPKGTDPRVIKRKRLAHYQCVACGMLWDDYKRNQAVKAGFWQAEVPVDRPQVVGFQLPAWYSPFVSQSDSVYAYLRGVEDPGKMMAFVNQQKAEVFRIQMVNKDEQAILAHRTDLPEGIIPAEALALTCFIDVQKFGFWFVVRAWAEDLTSWSIQYGQLVTWADVENLIYKTRYKIHGSTDTMGIWRAGIDTGGGETFSLEWDTKTEEIYEWLRKQPPIAFDNVKNPIYKVYGTKGASTTRSFNYKRIRITRIDTMPRSNKPIPGGLDLRLLHTDQYKTLIHWRLERTEKETQRFYLHAGTDEDYASQLLSERLEQDRKGKQTWKQVRTKNHLLDCEVGNAALADGEWLPSIKMLASYLRQQQPVPKTPPVASEASFSREDRREFSRPGWLNR